MLGEIETALTRYEQGTMSRRELVAAMLALAVPAMPGSQSTPVIGTATQLNHATVKVKDVAKSQEFYQRLFGMPVLTPQGAGRNLRAGAAFLGLYPIGKGEVPHIDHLCFSIDRFDATTVLSKLKGLGLDAEIIKRGDTEELYFTDADGIDIQIQDTKYRGGVGRLGDRNPA